MDWQPIETAPHDGTTVELLGENGKLDIGEWCEFSEHLDKAATGIAENVTGEFSTEYGEGPHTHWRPLALTSEFTDLRGFLRRSGGMRGYASGDENE